MNDQLLQTFFSPATRDAVLQGDFIDHCTPEAASGTADDAPDSGDDVRTDAEHTAALLAAEARIGGASTVLEIGGGCESLLLYLAKRFGCRGEGVFPDGDYVRFARESLAHQRYRLNIDFRRASAMHLPYGTGSFTHVVSRDALQGVPDTRRSHAEIHRVLRPGGAFACTEFVQPRSGTGASTPEAGHGLLGECGRCSMVEYQAALEEAGFEILLVRSLNGQLRRSYERNSGAARERAERTSDSAARGAMLDYASSCDAVCTALDRGELGWATFVCRKRDPR
ncbi:hypothetical protein GCM10027570_11070 [Streptomonospora sediminis]